MVVLVKLTQRVRRVKPQRSNAVTVSCHLKEQTPSELLPDLHEHTYEYSRRYATHVDPHLGPGSLRDAHDLGRVLMSITPAVPVSPCDNELEIS